MRAQRAFWALRILAREAALNFRFFLGASPSCRRLRNRRGRTAQELAQLFLQRQNFFLDIRRFAQLGRSQVSNAIHVEC